MKNKILVIEDDRAISELLCMNLEAAGYETVAAYDGEEAQRLLLWHEDADLAVVDIMLPGKDGFALMEDFKKKELPVLYLTAKDDVASKVKGLKLGAEDYMVKPFEMLELLVRNPNKVYSREALLNYVWGNRAMDSGDVRTVDVHVRRLREKIEPSPSDPRYVHTKWGVGYYFGVSNRG